MSKAKLNDAQRQVVDHDGKRLLVIAGPGTGKTHTLACRITCLAAQLAPNQRILAITFTQHAARQIEEYVMTQGVPNRLIEAGTLHVWCLKLLREHWEKTSLPKDFKIATQDDLKDFKPALLHRICLLKNTTLAIDADADFKQYTKILRQRNLIDRDDVLRGALELLEDEQVSAHVQQTYLHVCIDEYQDISLIQNALLKRLVGQAGSITAVGDPYQGTDRCHGGDASFMHRFMVDFEGAQIMKLTENFRSAPNVLAASMQVMRKASAGLDLVAKKITSGRLIMHEADSDRAEADYVASEIEKMTGGLAKDNAHEYLRSLGDIAIICRIDVLQTAIIQALEHLGIPYQVSGKISRMGEYRDDLALSSYEASLEFTVNKVSIMTIHEAKGAEFPVVFLVGCENHIMPLSLQAITGDEAEERRIVFVGMTRAKEILYLTYAKRRQLFGKTMQLPPSPFLFDIEEQVKFFDPPKKKIKQVTAVDDGQMQLF